MITRGMTDEHMFAGFATRGEPGFPRAGGGESTLLETAGLRAY